MRRIYFLGCATMVLLGGCKSSEDGAVDSGGSSPIGNDGSLRDAQAGMDTGSPGDLATGGGTVDGGLGLEVAASSGDTAAGVDSDPLPRTDAGKLPFDASPSTGLGPDTADAPPNDARLQSDGGGSGGADGSGTSTGTTLFPLSTGTNCYDVTGVSGVTDGCELQVAVLLGKALPGTYVSSSGQFALGTEGTLGTGLLSQNKGTLLRDSSVTDPTLPGCSWHQTVTTYLTMTAQNQFTISVTENQDSITAACGATAPTCSSTWTWTMAIDAKKLPPVCN